MYLDGYDCEIAYNMTIIVSHDYATSQLHLSSLTVLSVATADRDNTMC